MRKLILTALFYCFSLSAQENAVVVYQCPALQLKNESSSCIKQILFQKEKTTLHLWIDLKAPLEIKYLKEIYCAVDVDSNGKMEKTISTVIETKTSWLFHLNEKEDWKNWESIQPISCALSQKIYLSLDSADFKIEALPPGYCMQITLKFLKNEKEYYASAGFFTDTDVIASINGIAQEWKAKHLVFQRESKFLSSRIKAEKFFLRQEGALYYAALQTDKPPHDKIEYVDMRFYTPGDSDYSHYLIFNFCTGKYFIQDKKKNQWASVYLPFCVNDCIEWIFPAALIPDLHKKEISMTYKTLSQEAYYQRLYIPAGMDLLLHKDSLAVNESDCVYTNPGFAVRSQRGDFSKLYVKESETWTVIQIENNSKDYSELSEIGIYTDANDNGLPEFGFRLITGEDALWLHTFSDSWNWNNCKEIYAMQYTINQSVQIIFRNPVQSISKGHYKIQLHYSRKENNYYQARISRYPESCAQPYNKKLVTFKTTSLLPNNNSGNNIRCGYLNSSGQYLFFEAENSGRKYTDCTNFRIFFDTDFDGNWNYVLDFTFLNSEGHLYYLNNKNDWNGKSIHDLFCGFWTDASVRTVLPLALLPFDPNRAYLAFSFCYTKTGSTDNYAMLYGNSASEPEYAMMDGINNGEWKILCAQDRIWDQKNGLAANIHKIYCKEFPDFVAFAVDFNGSLNSCAQRIYLNCDSDQDGKNNTHVSVDLSTGCAWGYTPANKEDYSNGRLLPATRIFLSTDFLEFTVPKKYLAATDKSIIPEITFGLESLIQNKVYTDYAFGCIMPQDKIEYFDFYKQLSCVPLGDCSDYGNKIDVIILSDGYQISEKTEFLDTAKKTIDAFLSNKTFSLFKKDFQFYYIFAPSRDSGFYDGTKGGKIPDTPYKAGFWTQGFYTTKAKLEIAYSLQNVSDYDLIWLISHNDTNGHGTGSWVPGLEGLAVWGSAGIQTAIHETGHALFNLADEYEDAFYAKTGSLLPLKKNFQNYINVTVLDELDLNSELLFKKSLKWGWVYDYPQLRNITGLYEGALYESKDRYRPERTCVMRNGEPLGGSRFCVVCLDAIASKLASLCGREYDRKTFFSTAPWSSPYDQARQSFPNPVQTCTVLDIQSPDKKQTVDFQWIMDSNNTLDLPVPCSITFDFGSILTESMLALHFFQDQDFTYQYHIRIQYSQDNKKYSEAFFGKSSGYTAEKEPGLWKQIPGPFRYIKISCAQALPNQWLYLRGMHLFTKTGTDPLLLDYQALLKNME